MSVRSHPSFAQVFLAPFHVFLVYLFLTFQFNGNNVNKIAHTNYSIAALKALLKKTKLELKKMENDPHANCYRYYSIYVIVYVLF